MTTAPTTTPQTQTQTLDAESIDRLRPDPITVHPPCVVPPWSTLAIHKELAKGNDDARKRDLTVRAGAMQAATGSHVDTSWLWPEHYAQVTVIDLDSIELTGTEWRELLRIAGKSAFSDLTPTPKVLQAAADMLAAKQDQYQAGR